MYQRLSFPARRSGLRTIPHLADAFNVPIGLSDHTLGIGVPVAAVALEACLIEKHWAKLIIKFLKKKTLVASFSSPYLWYRMFRPVKTSLKKTCALFVQAMACTRYMDQVLGRRAVKDIEKGPPMSWISFRVKNDLLKSV